MSSAEKTSRPRREARTGTLFGTLFGTRSRILLTVSAIAGALYLVAVLVEAVILAVGNSVDFSGYAADGPLQLYNPLRRMAAGEIPGADFPFFHGVGVLEIHFPLFALFGENIFASEMSRWLTSPVLFLVATLTLMLSVFRGWRRAVIGTALATAAALILDRMVDPSNSLLGVRTTMPLLVAAAFIWRPRRGRELPIGRWDASRVLVWAGVGLAVSTGTEQGVATAGAVIVFRLVTELWRTRRLLRSLLATGVDAAAIAASVFAVSSILTLGHAPAALSYALIDVPQDQGWVFGAAPNISLTWDALWWSLRGGPTFTWGIVPAYWTAGLLGLALLALALVLRRVSAAIAFGIGMLFLYGCAVLGSMVGYINLDDQMAPLGRVAGVAIAVLVTAVLTGHRPAPTPRAGASAPRDAEPARRPRTRTIERRVLVPAAALAAIALVAVSVPPRAERVDAIKIVHSFQAAVAAPGETDYEISGTGWRYAIDTLNAVVPPGSSIWSTYTSLYESSRGLLGAPPGGEDYIIHAVGADRRAAYEQAFIDDAPDYVVTVSPAYFWYEEWLWSKWPRFYEEVFRDYQPIADDGSHIIWQRDPQPDSVSADSTELPVAPTADGADSFALPPNDTDQVKVYFLTVDYTASTPVPALARVPRYTIAFTGTGLTYPVSLPNYEKRASFPVVLMPHQTAPVGVAGASGVIPGARLSIADASYRELAPSGALQSFLTVNYCHAQAQFDHVTCPG
ncbi:hypothetical protein QT381_08075 [Galbitalea sp. SE-J8]|uniref:hypothetical protein n=1 Tax=Galbitalea sp. SE-J8 TaxID=3054952 RepID=UPI00259C7975|nr:hypothetical protein [Galbitalea sp. SE-J8]MDM4762962.1 hypothetical protein [Galbitalea sp. SE-J8]